MADLLTKDVQHISVDKLRCHPANPREGDVGAVWESIEQNGFFGALVVQKSSGHVLAGNHRLLAAREAGMDEVPVIYVDVDDEHAMRILLADNRTSDIATYDGEGLADLLEHLASTDDGLAGTGYDGDALDELLNDLGRLNGEPVEDPGAETDRADELREKWQTERGQLWQVGRHRLLCGDSTDAGDVERLLDGEKVQGVFTSPPYAEQRKGDYGGIPANEYSEWWSDVQRLIKNYLAPDGSLFVNIKAHSESKQLSTYVHQLVVDHVQRWGWVYKDEYCWPRVGIPGSPHKMHKLKNQWEPVYWFALTTEPYFDPDAVSHYSSDAIVGDNWTSTHGNYQGTGRGVGDRQTADGVAYPGNRLPFFGNAEAVGHTAAFPVNLPKFFIGLCSREDDVWYEPFCGSGSTILACQEVARVCYAMELLPKYAAVTLERLAGMGLEPKLITQ